MLPPPIKINDWVIWIKISPGRLLAFLSLDNACFLKPMKSSYIIWVRKAINRPQGNLLIVADRHDNALLQVLPLYGWVMKLYRLFSLKRAHWEDFTWSIILLLSRTHSCVTIFHVYGPGVKSWFTLSSVSKGRRIQFCESMRSVWRDYLQFKG